MKKMEENRQQRKRKYKKSEAERREKILYEIKLAKRKANGRKETKERERIFISDKKGGLKFVMKKKRYNMAENIYLISPLPFV